ncbi:MAG: YggT family protein [Chlamydiota bacterium]|nr:YggT family protein [Chlamydiota bacterium]
MIVVLKFIDILFMTYTIMLFGRILASWIQELQGTKLLQFISFYTDPYLNLFRRIIPPIGMLDLSPIIAFLCLGIIERIIKTIVIYIFQIF